MAGNLPRPFRVLLALVIAYAALALLVMFMQRRMIYFPSRFSEPVALQLAKQGRFEPWRAADGSLIGWTMSSGANPRGNVLVLHGNGGSALDRNYLADPLRTAGFNVFVLEYPGYGSRSGAPSQRSFLDAAEAAFRALPSNGPAYLVAESLGTGPAAHVAKLFPDRVSGMALFVPYNKLTSVAQYQMRLLPASLMLWDRYNPAEWLRDYRGPIVFVLAANDTVIPARFGQRLHDGYAGPKRLHLMPSCGHNDVAAQSAEWWMEVGKFWGSKKDTLNR